MESAADDKPEFFKILLGDFQQKLRIPPKFIKHMVSDHPLEATVWSSLGKSWKVKIQEEGGIMHFQDGWSQIVRAHHLEKGYVVTFRYEGDMLFIMRVFDLSACLKQYTPAAEKGIELNKANTTQTTSPSDQTAVPSPNRSLTRTRKARQVTETYPLKFSKNTPNQMVKIVTASNLTRCLMSVPQQFCKINGLIRKCEVTVKDPRGRSWSMTFSPGKSQGYLGRSWLTFSAAHNLKVGDKCVFKFARKGEEKKKKKVLRAEIIRS